MTQTRRSNVTRLQTGYTGYRWADLDPVMESLCHAIDQSGLKAWEISQKTYDVTRGVATVASSTINNWLTGKTKRPQNMTMDMVGFAIGKQRVGQNWEDITYDGRPRNAERSTRETAS
jgi:hypothetical protein